MKTSISFLCKFNADIADAKLDYSISQESRIPECLRWYMKKADRQPYDMPSGFTNFIHICLSREINLYIETNSSRAFFSKQQMWLVCLNEEVDMQPAAVTKN